MTTPDAHPRAALPEQKQRPGSDFQHAKPVLISTQHPRAGSNFLPSIVEPDSTVQTTAGLNRSPAFKQPTFPKKRSTPVSLVPGPLNDRRRKALAHMRAGDNPTHFLADHSTGGHQSITVGEEPNHPGRSDTPRIPI